MDDLRTRYRYTPYFCEENIWWLAHALCADGGEPAPLSIWLFSNRAASIAMQHQRAASVGALMAWDYHVVLTTTAEAGLEVFDFDTRLAFPSPAVTYLRQTFPLQQGLPAKWRTWVREIPAAAYLERFWSDRSHMQGHVPPTAFPDYPVIRPQDPRSAIALADYRDIDRRLDDGSAVSPVQSLLGAQQG